MTFELTCDWLELCEAPAIGMAAHPDHGVIPICKWHSDMFRISIIKPREEDH